MANLEVLSGRSEGALVELDEDGSWLVGTARRATLRLTDRDVSFVHATISAERGTYTIVDERSTVGTFVNNVLLEPEIPYALNPGDSIRFGSSVDVVFTAKSALERTASGRLGIIREATEELTLVADLRERLDAAEEERTRLLEEKTELRAAVDRERTQRKAAESRVAALETKATEREAQVKRLRANLEATVTEQARLRGELDSLKQA